MKLSSLIRWLAETMEVLGDREVEVNVEDSIDCWYSDHVISPVMGGDEDLLILNVVRKKEDK